MLRLRLRRAAVEDARRAVAACLAGEAAAEQSLAAAEAAIERETQAATRSASDAEVERFAAWLKLGRKTLAAAEAGRTAAAAGTAQARAALTLARAALHETETLIAQRQAPQPPESDRRTQAGHDEPG
ncbi:MAG: hypothetical protein JO264_01055 [Acidisphaera sp.]|nr:hypothetical protein [Acidisphaera sp.]